jgi:CopG family transcriptional regulator / antitoxin EndoAI
MKSKTLNLSIPEALLKKADAVAKREYRSRSELMREALRRYIDDVEEWAGIMEYGRKQARKRGVTSEKQINTLVRQARGKKKN